MAVNSSEQFVYDVCRKSFLSLWSYINSQGKNSGTELCDILVVCDPHVIVISVKDVALGNSGDIKTDWDRWHRKAVEQSIKQIKGAVRWLNGATQVIKKDGAPGLPLPPLERRAYHRIGVAFGGRRAVPIGCSGTGEEQIYHVMDEVSFRTLLGYLDTINDFVEYLGDKERFLAGERRVVSSGEENLLALYLSNSRKFPDQ